MLYVLVAKHSFPSRLHQEPTVHKSVPKPTAPASFKTTRGFPSSSQAFQPVCILKPHTNGNKGKTLLPQMNTDEHE